MLQLHLIPLALFALSALTTLCTNVNASTGGGTLVDTSVPHLRTGPVEAQASPLLSKDVSNDYDFLIRLFGPLILDSQGNFDFDWTRVIESLQAVLAKGSSRCIEFFTSHEAELDYRKAVEAGEDVIRTIVTPILTSLDLPKVLGAAVTRGESKGDGDGDGDTAAALSQPQVMNLLTLLDGGQTPPSMDELSTPLLPLIQVLMPSVKAATKHLTLVGSELKSSRKLLTAFRPLAKDERLYALYEAICNVADQFAREM